MRHSLSLRWSPSRRLVAPVSALAMLVPGVVVVTSTTNASAENSECKVDLVSDACLASVERVSQDYGQSGGLLSSGGPSGAPDDRLKLTTHNGSFCKDYERTFVLELGSGNYVQRIESTECTANTLNEKGTEHFYFEISELRSPFESGLGEFGLVLELPTGGNSDGVKRFAANVVWNFSTVVEINPKGMLVGTQCEENEVLFPGELDKLFLPQEELYLGGGSLFVQYRDDSLPNKNDKVKVGSATLNKVNDGTVEGQFGKPGDPFGFEDGDLVIFVSGSSGHEITLGRAFSTTNDGQYPITYFCQSEENNQEAAAVERVRHFAEPNGRVQSNIKLSNCGKDTQGNQIEPQNCVVGYGYNDEADEGNWDNTFELWFESPPGEVVVTVGEEPASPQDAVKGKCSSDDETSPSNGKSKLCFSLTSDHEEMEGEKPIKVNGNVVAQWDFFGELSSGWDGNPAEGHEWADYHVLLVQEGARNNFSSADPDFTNFCSEGEWLAKLPTKDSFPSDPLLCQQDGVEVRAVFDWANNWANKKSELKQLDWLEKVQQFGSRSALPGESVETVSGRVRNQLAEGQFAFYEMAGTGRGIEDLDTSNLTDMSGMFQDAALFSRNLEHWKVSGLGVGAPVDFDLGTAAWETGLDDEVDRNGTGKGRPGWNEGQVVVSAPKVRAERTSDGGLSLPALNAFSIETVKQAGVASSAGQNFNLGYEVGEESVTQEVLENDASTPLSVGVGEEPRNGRVEVAKSAFPVEVTVTAADAGLIAEGTFEVFAPCKTEPQDVAVTVKQVPSRIRGGVAVEVELHAGLGVLPPGNVTVHASDGSQTALSVPGGQPSGSVVAEWEWRASGDPRSGTTDDAVSLVFGVAFADFTWSPADTGDDGPECASQSVVSRSDVTALEVNFESAEIDKCEVGAALLDLLSDLQAPGTPRQSTLTARSLPLTEPAADSDADGVPDALDQDLDGDGVQNQVDPDIDGDGTPNGADKDIDGDGLSNGADEFPNGPPPVVRPMPIGVTDAERDALLEQLYGEQVPVTFPVPDGDYAEGAGQIVVGPDPEIMVEVAIMNLNDQENFSKLCPDLQLPVLPMPGLPGPETGNELPDVDGSVFPILPDGGGKPDSESGSGAGSGSGSGSSGGSGNLRIALGVPSEAFKGVPTELEAEVYPASTNGYVEFAVQEIDLTGRQSVRILGSAPVEKEQVTVDGQTVTVARASLDLVPEDYGDAIVYARVTEKGSGAQDTTARAAVVNPAPFADNFSLTVGGDAWLPVETGNVLGYGYSPVEFTTMTGEAPRITTPVDGPCQVLSTRSIPPQIRMLGTAIAPKRCSFTVTTPGGGAYAPVSYTYDVALSMGTQTATLAADKAKKTIKKGSIVTVAKKTQTRTDEDYKLKGKKINWSVTSGRDVCSVKTSSSGKVSLKGKKKGTCTVKAKASKAKRKYKSFTEFYNFQVK